MRTWPLTLSLVPILILAYSGIRSAHAEEPTTGAAPPIECPKWAPLKDGKCVPVVIAKCPKGYELKEGLGCIPKKAESPPPPPPGPSCSAPTVDQCPGCAIQCNAGQRAICTPGSWQNMGGWSGWKCNPPSNCRCE